jgi:hypothetical protein
MIINDDDISLPLFIHFANDEQYLEKSMNKFLSSTSDEMLDKLLTKIEGDVKNNFSQNQYGGKPIINNEIESNLYEFLMLCDSIHDFGRIVDVQQIYKWLPMKLLSVFKKNKKKGN